MEKIFFSYGRDSKIVTVDNIKKAKDAILQETYFDCLDNFVINPQYSIKQEFSNKAIGFTFYLVNDCDAFCLIESPNVFSNRFTWLEVLDAHERGKKLIYINEKDFLDITTKKYGSADLFKYAKEINYTQFAASFAEKCVDKSVTLQTFVAYGRDGDKVTVNMLKNFKSKISGKNYIDCLDNNFANQNPESYAAYNPNCRFSMQIFNKAFEELIKADKFCIIDSPYVYQNYFTRLQVMTAHALRKTIYVVPYDKYLDILDGNSKVNLEDIIKPTAYGEMMAHFNRNCKLDNKNRIFENEIPTLDDDGKLVISQNCKEVQIGTLVLMGSDEVRNQNILKCNEAKEVIISANVRKIGAWAFEVCPNLKVLDLSKAISLEYIAEDAFIDCKVEKVIVECPSKTLLDLVTDIFPNAKIEDISKSNINEENITQEK